MRVKILQEDLAKAANIVSKFVSTRATLPILTQIVLKTRNSKLYLQATNLESSISYSIGAQILEEGDMAVPAKLLTELMNTFPKGQVSIEAEQEKVKMECSGFRGTITGMATSDFPEVPMEIEKEGIKIASSKLLEILQSVLFSVSRDESRPILTGCLFSFSKDGLMVAGSDGFRISINKISTTESSFPELKMVVPYVFLQDLIKILPNYESVTVYPKKDENQVLFGFPGVTMLSRIIAGDFPDFSGIIPKNHSVRVNIEKQSFLQALKLSAVFAKDSANIVSLKIGDSQMEVISESSTSGNQITKIDAKVEGGELTAMFNYRFIEEFLNASLSDEIIIELVDSYSPTLFKDVKQLNLVHIIMPIKL